MVTSNYSCTQQELYTVCRQGWQSCSQHLADFAAFKAKYDAPYIAAALASVEAAATLPDYQARSAESEVLRIQLTQTNTACLAHWQKLKRYITDAFPAEILKPRLEEAGQLYYEKAAHLNWDSTRGLLSMGSLFIQTHLADLTASLNMPPAFQATFDTDKAKFESQHQAFLDSEELTNQATEVKILANNQIHASLMSMFLDGQEIFRDQEAIGKQFIFDQLLYLASGSGVAGIRGIVFDDATGYLITDATITIFETDKSTTSDAEGKYHLNQVAAGTYTLVITAAGYQTQKIDNYLVKTGTQSIQDIRLVAL